MHETKAPRCRNCGEAILTPEELLAARAKGEAGADQARSLADVQEG